MEKEISVGSVVISTAGRDCGRHYLVLEEIDKNFVLATDGVYKLLSNPKKKRVKHLKNTGVTLQIIKEKLQNKKKVFDSEIYSALKGYINSKVTK